MEGFAQDPKQRFASALHKSGYIKALVLHIASAFLEENYCFKTLDFQRCFCIRDVSRPIL